MAEQGPQLTEGITSVRQQFTKEEFDEALQKFGAKNLAEALTQRASALMPDEYKFTFEDFQSGDAPILDQMPLFREMSKDDRQRYFADLNSFYSLFANVEDFGKYDPKVKSKPGAEAAADKFARNIPIGTAMGEGLLVGSRLAKSVADKIPVRDPRALALKLGIYGTGATLGAVGGAMVGQEASDFIFGEEPPVSPSLRAYQNFGETTGLTINPSFLSQTRRWTTDKNWLGASNFLENFKKVTRDRWPGYGNAFDLTGGAAGLSAKQLEVARNAQAGLLIDYTKGPTGVRMLSAFEKALPAAQEFAVKNPYFTLGLDALSGVGAGTGAFVAEEMAPGSNGTRLLLELIGGGLPGPAVELGTRGGAAGFDKLKTAFMRYYLDKEGAMTSAQEKLASNRIYSALEQATESDTNQIDLLLGIIAEEAALIEDGAKSSVSLAAAAKGSKLAPALVQIDQMLSKGLNELSVTSKAGKEAWIQGAKNKILEFQNSGDPTLVATANLLQKGLFEEALAGEMQSRVNRMYSALKAVAGDDPNNLQKYPVADMLYQRLSTFVSDTKQMEGDFWNNVTNFELTEFRNANGELQDLPNTVQIFDTPKSQGGLQFPSQTGRATFLAAAPKGLAKDLKEIFEYFGQSFDDVFPEVAEEASEQMSGRLRTALSSFEETQDALRGTDSFNVLQRDIERVNQMDSVDEKVTYLRSQAEMLKSNARDYDNPRTVQRLGTALDRLATVEQARAQQEATDLAQSVVPGEEAPNPMTSERLIEIRSKLLEAAGNLRSGTNKRGNSDTAEKLDRLANAVLDDVLSADTDAADYNAARAFTLARRDLTQRTFLGDLGNADPLGRPRVTPEGMLDYMFKGGNDSVLRRFNELETVNQFIRTQMGLPESDAAEYAGDVANAYENAFRYTASKIMVDRPDPNDMNQTIKMVDPKRLRDFKADPANQQILATMPNLAKDLKSASKAQMLFSSIDPDKFFKQSPEMKAFELAANLGTERPGKAVAKIMGQDNPFRDLNFMLNGVRNEQKARILQNGEVKVTTKPRKNIFSEDGTKFTVGDAEQGMRSAIMNYAIMRGGGDGLSINPKNIFDTLFTKPPGIKDADNTLMNWMRKNDLVTEDEATIIRQSLREMINVEEAFQQGNLENVLFKNPTQSKRTGIRILGATLGQKSQESLNNMLSKIGLGTTGGGIGGGMIAAEEGSTALQNILLVAPETAVVKTMQKLMEDPKKFSEMLLDIRNAKQDAASTERLNNLLAEFGVNQLAKRDAVILRSLLLEEEEFEPEALPEAVPSQEETTPQDQRNLRGRNRPRDDRKPMQLSPQPPAASQGRNVPRSQPVGTPTTQAAPPAPQNPMTSGAGTNPQLRQQYAALFPNDPISGMLVQRPRTFRRGGIATLME